jgi:hypothetical protein
VRVDRFRWPTILVVCNFLIAWRFARFHDTSFHSPISYPNLGEVASPAGGEMGIEFAKLILSRRLSSMDQLGEFY